MAEVKRNDKMVHPPVLGRRAFVGGALTASTLAFLSACGQKGAGGAAGTGGGTLKFYINNPVAIDPYNVQETQGAQVVHQLFDQLTVFDFEKEELVGLAAESWDANDDATEFTFHLVPDATFHNGDPVTAADFKRGWERAISPKSAVALAYTPGEVSYHLSLVEGYDALASGKADELAGVTCPDDETLVVKLSASYADFPYVCAHPALSPVPKAAEDDAKAFYLAPIGNGPFKMDGKWEDGQEIKLTRFDDYYGKKAKVDAVIFSIQKDIETAYKEFQAGNLDVAEVPTAQLDAAREQLGVSKDGYTMGPGEHLLLGAQVAVYFLVCNNADGPFADANLRRGVSLAINREAICKTLFKGARQPAGGVIPPGIDGYREGAWDCSVYDIDRANEYLDLVAPMDANGSRGISLTLTYNQDGGHKEIMESVIGDLAKVGISVTSDTPEWSAALTQYHDGAFQFGRSGWTADYPIMDNFLYPLFHSDSIGGDNFCQYSNPEVDAAIEEARATVDTGERIAKLQAAEDLISQDCPLIPIMYYVHDWVGSDRVKSLYVNPQVLCDLNTAELEA